MPGELFEKFKDYLQEKGIKQNAFFLDCIRQALAEDTGAAEEDHIPAAVYCFPQRLYRCVFFHFSVLSGRVCPWFVASFCAFFRTEPIGASKKKRLRLIF